MSTFSSKLACIDIYDPITPNVFDKIYRVGETTCGTKLVDNRLYIVCQGTENVPGWIADADVIPFVHPIIGTLHSGFWENLPVLIEQLKVDIPAGVDIEVTGHSKGAGEGVQLAGALHAYGFNVVHVELFACPHAGFQDFADYMQKNISGVSWRNSPAKFLYMGDPVPMVPLNPFVAPYPLTYMDVPPDGAKRLVDVEWHMGVLYDQGAT
jgi:hypothetical protein